MKDNMSKTELPEEQPGAATIIQVIERAAMNPDVDIDKMERLLEMQERILARQSEVDFNCAMSAAQSEMGRISADATNPQTRSKYASYAALDKTLRPIYTGHGFAISFDTDDSQQAEFVRVVAYVSHTGGHTRTYHVDIPSDGKGIKGAAMMTRTHAAGSAMAYGMRYLLKLVFNVAVGEDDDDGNGEIQRISPEQAEKIRKALQETGSDERAFCKYMMANDVESIRASEFDRAMSALAKKGKK
jgi:hypothetical protein